MITTTANRASTAYPLTQIAAQSHSPPSSQGQKRFLSADPEEPSLGELQYSDGNKKRRRAVIDSNNYTQQYNNTQYMSSEDADNSEDDEAKEANNLGNTTTTTGPNDNKDISPAVKRLYQHQNHEPQATQLDDFYMSIENPVASPSSSSTNSGSEGNEGRENRAHIIAKSSIFEHVSQANPSRPQTQSILASKASSSSSSSSSSALFPELNHPYSGLPNIVALTPILNTLHPHTGNTSSAVREGEAYTFTQPPDSSAMELGASLLLSQSSVGGGMILSPRSHSPLLSDRGINPQASPLASGDKPDGFETELKQSQPQSQLQQPQSHVQSAKSTVSFSQTSVTRRAYTQAEPALDTSNLQSNDTSVDLGPAATTDTVTSAVTEGVVENEVTKGTNQVLVENEAQPTTTASQCEMEAPIVPQPEKGVEALDEQQQVQPAIPTDDMDVTAFPTTAATDAILQPVDQSDKPSISQHLTTPIAPTAPTTTAITPVTSHTAIQADPPGAFETWDDEPTDKPVAEMRNPLITIDSTNKQHKRFTDADDDDNGADEENNKDTNMQVEQDDDDEEDEGVAVTNYNKHDDDDPHPDTDPPIHKPLAIAHSQPLPRRRTSYLAETCYSHSQDDSQHLYLKHADRMFTIGASGM